MFATTSSHPGKYSRYNPTEPLHITTRAASRAATSTAGSVASIESRRNSMNDNQDQADQDGSAGLSGLQLQNEDADAAGGLEQRPANSKLTRSSDRSSTPTNHTYAANPFGTSTNAQHEQHQHQASRSPEIVKHTTLHVSQSQETRRSPRKRSDASIVSTTSTQPVQLTIELVPDANIADNFSDTSPAKGRQPTLASKGRGKGRWPRLAINGRKARVSQVNTPRIGSPSHDADNDDDIASQAEQNLLKVNARKAGRRRAAHPDINIEVDLRRQLQLKTTYRSVARALKPILAELARQELEQVETDIDYHRCSPLFDHIRNDLDTCLADRLARLDVELRYAEVDACRVLTDGDAYFSQQYEDTVAHYEEDFSSAAKLSKIGAIHENILHAQQDTTRERRTLFPECYGARVSSQPGGPLGSEYASRSRHYVMADRTWDVLESWSAEGCQPNQFPAKYCHNISSEFQSTDRKDSPSSAEECARNRVAQALKTISLFEAIEAVESGDIDEIMTSGSKQDEPLLQTSSLALLADLASVQEPIASVSPLRAPPSPAMESKAVIVYQSATRSPTLVNVSNLNDALGEAMDGQQSSGEIPRFDQQYYDQTSIMTVAHLLARDAIEHKKRHGSFTAFERSLRTEETQKLTEAQALLSDWWQRFQQELHEINRNALKSFQAELQAAETNDGDWGRNLVLMPLYEAELPRGLGHAPFRYQQVQGRVPSNDRSRGAQQPYQDHKVSAALASLPSPPSPSPHRKEKVYPHLDAVKTKNPNDISSDKPGLSSLGADSALHQWRTSPLRTSIKEEHRDIHPESYQEPIVPMQAMLGSFPTSGGPFPNRMDTDILSSHYGASDSIGPNGSQRWDGIALQTEADRIAELDGKIPVIFQPSSKKPKSRKHRRTRTGTASSKDPIQNTGQSTTVSTEDSARFSGSGDAIQRRTSNPGMPKDPFSVQQRNLEDRIGFSVAHQNRDSDVSTIIQQKRPRESWFAEGEGQGIRHAMHWYDQNHLAQNDRSGDNASGDHARGSISQVVAIPNFEHRPTTSRQQDHGRRGTESQLHQQGASHMQPLLPQLMPRVSSPRPPQDAPPKQPQPLPYSSSMHQAPNHYPGPPPIAPHSQPRSPSRSSLPSPYPPIQVRMGPPHGSHQYYQPPPSNSGPNPDSYLPPPAWAPPPNSAASRSSAAQPARPAYGSPYSRAPSPPIRLLRDDSPPRKLSNPHVEHAQAGYYGVPPMAPNHSDYPPPPPSTASSTSGLSKQAYRPVAPNINTQLPPPPAYSQYGSAPSSATSSRFDGRSQQLSMGPSPSPSSMTYTGDFHGGRAIQPAPGSSYSIPAPRQSAGPRGPVGPLPPPADRRMSMSRRVPMESATEEHNGNLPGPSSNEYPPKGRGGPRHKGVKGDAGWIHVSGNGTQKVMRGQPEAEGHERSGISGEGSERERRAIVDDAERMDART